MPEPDAVKIARPVLRRERAGNRSFLFDYALQETGRNSVKSNNGAEGRGESKKQKSVCNRLNKGSIFALIRKDADLLNGVQLHEWRYDL